MEGDVSLSFSFSLYDLVVLALAVMLTFGAFMIEDRWGRRAPRQPKN